MAGYHGREDTFGRMIIPLEANGSRSLRNRKPLDTRYLGLHYGPKRHFTKCIDELLGEGCRAVHGLHAMRRSKGINASGKLFHYIVLPVLSYGAQQVRGPDFINVGFATAMASKAAEVQRAYMRAGACSRREPHPVSLG